MKTVLGRDVTTGTNRKWYTAYRKATIANILCVWLYFKVICRLQSFSNRMFRSCKISTDKHIVQ